LDRDFLVDIVELIETIERHRPASEAALTGDEVLFTAVVHWMQTNGEAASGYPRMSETVTPRCRGARSST